MDEEPMQEQTIEVPVKSNWEAILSNAKTLLWTTFWVGLTFFVDNVSQLLIGVSLPDLHISTTAFGLLAAPFAMTVNTSVVVGFVINRASKYLHDRSAGKIQ